MGELLNIEMQGLNTYASNRIDSQNSLYDCNNIVCDQGGIISIRRGFQYYADTLVAIKKIFSAIQNFFTHANSALYYNNAGTFTQITFPNTDTFDANSTSQKVQIDDVNKSLFFNGKRVSSESGNPIDKKIKKLTSVSANVINSGLEAPINLSLVASSSGAFSANDSVAVRVFYQYVDENNFVVTSAVSDRTIGVNDLGVTAKFALTFQIPNQLMDKPVNIYYAISSEVTDPITPDDNLFWGENTLVASGVTINTGISSVFTVTEILPRDSIINPVDLYTNSSQEGILQNNSPAVCSVDIETYQGYTFFGNLIDRLIKRVFSLEIPLNAVALTLDGIAYTRKSTSNYSAYEFSGSNTLYSVIDLCRCVTATQTKYKMGFESSPSGAEIWTEKAFLPSYDDPNVPPGSPFGSCCTNGERIYIKITDFLIGVDEVIQVYNTISNSYENSIDLPVYSKVGGTIQYYNNKLYLIGGTNAGSFTRDTLIYDLLTETWSYGSPHPSDMSTYMSSAIYNGVIYTFGGSQDGYGGSIDARTYKYDIGTDTWTQLTSMPAAKFMSSAAYYDGYIYVIGGQTGASTTTNTVYRYSIAGDSWSTMTALTVNRTRGSAVAYNNNIYFMGGSLNTTISVFTGTSTMYIYSIADNSWALSPEALIENVVGHSSVKSGDAMYIFGGVQSYDGSTNSYVAITASQKYQFGGVYCRIEERFIGEETDIIYTSDYVSDVNFEGSTSAKYRYESKNTVQFSKQGQPEAVPFLNNFQAGSASYDIIRLSALRTSLMILKKDGIYQLNGVSPETFSVQQLDPTFILIAAQSVAKLNNEIYCLTNKGIVTINESGAQIISYAIKDLIDTAVATISDLNTEINATAYEDDYKYIINIGSKTFTYNYVTQQWTIWFAGITDIQSLTVFNSKLYYANETRVLEERKTFTSDDFQDELNAGIDCMIEFNNQEPSPGRIIGITALLILQYDISNVTVSITPINSFNDGEEFSDLLDVYVKRLMFPNSCRTAFFFNPHIEWNSELVATPGTFSNLKLEGFYYDYEVTEANTI